MLDFTKQQKKLFVLKLFDGTTLNIAMPRKKTFEKMAAMNIVSVENINAADINSIYDLVAEILTSNTQKKVYTAEDVGEIFDFDDITTLLNEYMNFAGYVTNDPN